jgi:hypothetical protein
VTLRGKPHFILRECLRGWQATRQRDDFWVIYQGEKFANGITIIVPYVIRELAMPIALHKVPLLSGWFVSF